MIGHPFVTSLYKQNTLMQFGQTLSVIEEHPGSFPPVVPIKSILTTIEIDEGLNGRRTAEGWVFRDLAVYINDDHQHVLVHLPTKVEIFETSACHEAWMVKIYLIRLGVDLKRLIDDRRYGQHVMRILADFLDPQTIQGFLL
jgi:hypothetical protein